MLVYDMMSTKLLRLHRGAQNLVSYSMPASHRCRCRSTSALRIIHSFSWLHSWSIESISVCCC